MLPSSQPATCSRVQIAKVKHPQAGGSGNDSSWTGKSLRAERGSSIHHDYGNLACCNCGISVTALIRCGVYLGFWQITVSGIRGTELLDSLVWVTAEDSVHTLRNAQILCEVFVLMWVSVACIHCGLTLGIDHLRREEVRL